MVPGVETHKRQNKSRRFDGRMVLVPEGQHSQPGVSTLIIIHKSQTGNGHNPGVKIDCPESIARWCKKHRLEAHPILHCASECQAMWQGQLDGYLRDEAMA
jgi:hypothetical protein